MSFSNTQLTKNMSLQLFIILRTRKNMSFSYMQLMKKYVITIIFMTS